MAMRRIMPAALALATVLAGCLGEQGGEARYWVDNRSTNEIVLEAVDRFAARRVSPAVAPGSLHFFTVDYEAGIQVLTPDLSFRSIVLYTTTDHGTNLHRAWAQDVVTNGSWESWVEESSAEGYESVAYTLVVTNGMLH